MKAIILAVALSACVPSQAELRRPVDRDLAQRLGAPIDPVEIDKLLAAPLDAATATKIALANSARLAAAYDQLGIAAGDVASALGVGPVSIDLQARFGGGGHEYEIDAIQNLIGLITASRRRAAANAELAAVRAEAVATALRLVAHVEIAFRDLIAAQQELELRRTAFEAADAAATLRERMADAGNTTTLALARDREAREQTRIDVARAETAIAAKREALNALLGLTGAQTAWTATGTLPDLGPPPQLDAIEATSVTASLELEADRDRVAAATNRASDERLRRWLPELGVGVSVIDDDFVLKIGPAIRLGLPLFDQRSGQIARSEAELRSRQHELSAIGVELRAAARATRIATLAAYAEARQLHDVVLPLRQQIVHETLLHYNAMDADPFQLIAARRSLADAGHQYLDALRRYWNGMTEAGALAHGVELR